MRKLVDAPRKKKQWTEKEEAYLQDKWGAVSIKGLSKALGRSENAIIVRAQRLGCGAHLAGDTRISLNQLMLAIYGKNMLGYTSDRLIRYGLPVKWHVVKKNRFRVIDIDAFWKWAEDNKSILDFSRFEKYGLGAEPDWVDVKRKADYKKLQLHGQHNAAWTKDEVETLCRMVDEGYDFTLIAEKLNRTALATRGKFERLQNPEYNKRYNRGQNRDYEYQGIRSISGKGILKDMELMDGVEFQELQSVQHEGERLCGK